jgi:ABC-type transport system substrate-binding protein
VRQPGAVIYAKDNWKLADETDQAVPGGVYPGRNTADLSESMDPFLATQGRGDQFTDIGYEYLVVPNRGPGIEPTSAEGQSLRPHLAESYEVSNDGLSYTFTLRRGVKYHPIPPVNGREMTIDDWKTSFQRNAEIGSNRSSYLEVVDKAEYPDSRHMVIKMKEPYAPFLNRCWDYNFAWKAVPRELNQNPDLLARQMIGTGYRMMDVVQPSVTWEFKRWDQYWEGKPFIERWHYPLITEAANAYAQFLSQKIISLAPGAASALALRGDAPRALMLAVEIPIETAIRANFGKQDAATSPWKDSRVRIGLHKIMDWDAWQTQESNLTAFRAAGIEPELAYTTHVPWDRTYFLDPRKNELGEASKNYLYDPAAAKQMITAAGYPEGFEIDYWTRSSAADLSQVHLDYWQKSGIVRPVRHNVSNQEYADKIVNKVEFKGVQVPASSSGTDVDYLLSLYYHSSGIPGSLGYDPELDRSIEAQRRERDPQKRADYIKDFQRQVAKSFVHLPGNHRFSTWRFEWPWLHNVNQRPVNRSWPDDSFLNWLDPNMPNRNGES